jgi:GGDEF domain-containing protein
MDIKDSDLLQAGNRLLDAVTGDAVVPMPREVARLETVRRVALSLSREDPALRRLGRVAAQALGYPAVAIVLLQDAWPDLVGSYGLSEENWPEACALSVWRRAVVSNRVATGVDAMPDRTPAPAAGPATGAAAGAGTAGAAWQAAAVAPLRAPNGLTVGGLGLLDIQARPFGEAEELLLRDLRDTAEELIRLRGEVLHDPVTGVWASHYFELMLHREWQSIYTQLRPVTLMCLRVAPVTDAGRLRHIASFLASTFRRSSDILGRCGEHDFLALLPETNAQGASSLANWLRSSLGESLGDPGLKISVGVAVATSEDTFQSPPDRLLRAAQAAMLAAHRDVDGRCVLNVI